jgi:hypothetical protein
VLEACRRDERRPGAAPFEEGGRRGRRAMGEAVDGHGADRGRRREDGLLLPRRRGDLRGADLAVRDEHGVGERPPDVDSEHAHRAILTSFGRRVRSRVSATWTASSASG